MTLNHFLIILLKLLTISAVDQIQNGLDLKCKDDFGQDVDWFVAYKLPKDPLSKDGEFSEGSTYFYLTSLTKEEEIWRRSDKKIHESDSIIGQTLSKLYINNSSDYGYALYNDQPPHSEPVIRNGHTKGIILTTSKNGIFLQHSVPHFPLLSKNMSNFYPIGGLENGKLFLCLSLNLSQIEIVAQGLIFTRPNFYEVQIDEDLAKILPLLTQVAKFNETTKVGPWGKKLRLEAGGMEFNIYAKGPKFRKEIYGDWIAPDLKTSLNVQSWLNGPHPIQTNCNASFFAKNILSTEIGNEKFSHLVDHSKWAISVNNNSNWACFGDLNRMKPQKTRGGFVICSSHKVMWKSFNSSILATQPCSLESNEIPSPRKYKKVKHSRKNKKKSL